MCACEPKSSPGTGDLSLFEQIVCDIARRIERFPQSDSAQQFCDIGEDVEGAFGFSAAEAVNRIQSRDNRIPPPLEFPRHDRDIFLLTPDGLQSRGLSDRGRIRSALTLNLCRCRNHVARAERVTDSPA